MNYIEIYQQYMYSYPHKSTYQPVERLDLTAYRDAFVGAEMGLYFHIPFCQRKCGYCNLFSLTGVRADDYGEYIQAIRRHSAQMKAEMDFHRTRFSSLIFGGGTPLLLDVPELALLFALAQEEYQVNLTEVFSVIESSPAEITPEKLEFLKGKKLKRLSIGIQSFQAEELKKMERRAEPKLAHQAIKLAKQMDFPVLNIDLIYGIPQQTEGSWRDSLEKAVAYQPEEIFLYPLYNQPNAGLYHKFLTDEASSRQKYELYWIGSRFLRANGYRQKSMRCFSRLADSHADCGFENTLALGCGGRSYFYDLHFCEPYVAGQAACQAEYRHYLQKTDFLRDLSMVQLPKIEQKRRYVIKNILYYTGLSVEDYRQHFAADLTADFPLLQELKNKAWMKEESGRFFLTEQGMSLSDYIGPMLAEKADFTEIAREGQKVK